MFLLNILIRHLILLPCKLFVWVIIEAGKDIDKENECYYDICGDYEEAYYSDNICYCYDYDVLGSLQIVKTEWIK